MPATYGEGTLGEILAPNLRDYRYQLNWIDLLWLGRMLMGEPLRGAGEVEWAALCWHYAQRHAWKRIRDTPFNGSDVQQATREANARDPGANLNRWRSSIFLHSQPINPRWFQAGALCRPGGRRHGDIRCTDEKGAARQARFALSWDRIGGRKRDFLVRWARAQVDNPIPGYIDFAGYQINVRRGFSAHRQVDSSGRNGAGNWFYKWIGGGRNGNTDEWPDDMVRIRYEETESSPELQGSEGPMPSPTGETSRTSSQRNSTPSRVFVREHEITSNRSAPPDVVHQYSTLSGSTQDGAAADVFSAEQEDRTILLSQKRFASQIHSLGDVSTLNMAQAVPIIEISTQDENGELVSLNSLLFGTSPLNEFFKSDQVTEGRIGSSLPARPIASIVGLNLKVETPSTGGPSAVTTGKLSLKIHNPTKVTINHPRGKFVSWMMRHGFWMRIKYGVRRAESEDSEILKNAFQWKEEDFTVAQHDINVNNDSTYDLNLVIMPASHKLFNQIHIGESIPFSDLQNGGDALTDEDLDNVFDSITIDGEHSSEEMAEMRRSLQRFQREFNTGEASAGYRIRRNTNADTGVVTIGSVLHGAIAHSDILNNPEGRQPVPIENMVDGIRSIQSILLTRRYETMLAQDSYNATIKNVQAVAINLGPLFFRLVLPEFKQIALYISQNELRAGEVYSSDLSAEDPVTRRSEVRLVFGLFNARAGSNWANRPISEMPLNVNTIFGLLRTERRVGHFSSKINAFIQNISRMVREPTNFTIERVRADDGTSEPVFRLERPQIKYAFFPDPVDSSRWIFYIYDNKRTVVQFSNLLGELNENPEIGREELMEKLTEVNIPWIEMGDEGSIIKNMSARTVADDLIMAQNMRRANHLAITSRDIDGAIEIPTGVSGDFLNGMTNNPQDVIRATTLILPIQVTTTTYMLATANLFLPIYVFFPTKMFEGAFMPMVVEHEIKDGLAITKMMLQINITQANRTSH